MKPLIYTIAFDDGPIPYHRWMAMMLISSLQRSGYEVKCCFSPTRKRNLFGSGVARWSKCGWSLLALLNAMPPIE